MSRQANLMNGWLKQTDYLKWYVREVENAGESPGFQSSSVEDQQFFIIYDSPRKIGGLLRESLIGIKNAFSL